MYDKNVYYHPEMWDLTPVAECEKEPDYDFEIVALWKHKDGKHYAAASAGCSCPTPFEEYNSLADLVEVRSVDDLKPLLTGSYGISDEDQRRFLELAKASL